MDCKFKDREAFIEKYLRNELNEADQILFEEHFFSCEECFSELESTKLLKEMIQEEGKALFPEYNESLNPYIESESKIRHFIKIIFPHQWYLQPFPALTFLVASLIIAAIYFLNPAFDLNDSNVLSEEKISSNDRRADPQTDEISTDEIIANSGDEVSVQADANNADSDKMETENVIKEVEEIEEFELYAANFIESDDLENMIDQQFRSSEDITIVSPENGITVTDEIIFNWISEKQQRLHLKILNNEEDVLFKFSTIKTKISFNVDDNELDPGLYYWKLENDAELFHIGKFVIK